MPWGLDLGEEAAEDQELWHLAPLRLALWNPQHVQGGAHHLN